MKRLSLLILLLCILLSSCKTTTSGEPQEPTDPTAAPVTESTLNVKTDFSSYTKKESLSAKYTRLSDGPLDDLHPTDTGKQIYPFIGLKLDNGYMSSYRYGIVDRDGCVLADPVYSEVTPLIDADTNTVLPIWLLKKTDSPSDPEVSHYVYGTEYYGLAAMDGSFVTECIYSDIYCNDGRIIAFRYREDFDDPTKFDVYDLEGHLLFTSADLSFAHKLRGECCNYKYGQGLYTAVFENLTDYPTMNHGTSLYGDYEYYLMDESGTLLAGPFYDVVSLTGGPIAVMLQSGEYVYVNTKGEIISEAYYELDEFRNDSAPIMLEYDPYYSWMPSPSKLVNGELEILTTADCAFRRMEDGNYYTCGAVIEVDENGYETDYYKLTTCYSSKGEILWTRRGTYEVLTADIAIKQGLEPSGYRYTDLYLEHIPSGNTFPLPEDSTVNLIGDPADPIFELRYCVQDQTYLKMLNADLDTLITFLDFPLIQNTAEIGEYSYKALLIRDSGNTTVYQGGHSVFAQYPIGKFNVCKLYPDHIAAFTDEECTRFYTAEGELIFVYPISIMDD
ncbi:MAG: hypothetical protein IKT58_03880 [Oscillospiraceae bacterium]|nr:hypothetical protein [Oscillospiraceae bacterium]